MRGPSEKCQRSEFSCYPRMIDSHLINSPVVFDNQWPDLILFLPPTSPHQRRKGGKINYVETQTSLNSRCIYVEPGGEEFLSKCYFPYLGVISFLMMFSKEESEKEAGNPVLSSKLITFFLRAGLGVVRLVEPCRASESIASDIFLGGSERSRAEVGGATSRPADPGHYTFSRCRLPLSGVPV